jgi:hypothetical protein
MTHTLPSADIRGYYQALGIRVAQWARDEASVRCFADPEGHARGDRHPSCSINLNHGAWRCHGCNASGGPFDAAICRGHSNRSAIELMICHGLTQRRHPASRSRQHAVMPDALNYPRAQQPARPRFTLSNADIYRWCRTLDRDARTIERLVADRAWSRETVRQLELGLDRGRITIPVRDHRRRLVGLLRYRPWARDGQIKMSAAVGSRRQLLPHPALEPSSRVLLVEGEPDMIAARSLGLPAIALPGVDSWKDDWAAMFAGRQIVIALDCDRHGRTVAQSIADRLSELGLVRVVDLAPSRNDGYDFTDWILDGASDAESLIHDAISERSDDEH